MISLLFINMSLYPSASHKLIRYTTTEYEEKHPQMVRSESNLKKASTFPADLPLDVQLFGVEKTTYQQNPFLKARVKAYLQDLDKSCKTITIRKEESIKDTQAPLFNEQRVTLKNINETRRTINQATAHELKMKFMDAAKMHKN